MFPFIQKRKIFYSLSGLLVLLALGAIIFYGFAPSIEFTGGSSLNLTYKSEIPSSKEIRTDLEDFDLGDISVQREGEKGVILKMKTISEETRQEIVSKLGESKEIVSGKTKFHSVGPVIGEEVKNKTLTILWITLAAILIYIALSFRKVSRPVKSYVYGISSLIALFHDVAIPLGVIAVLGKFGGVELSVPIVTAFLTVFGYSINDSVVVFDRVRENLLKLKEPKFGVLVEKSLNEVLSRSVSTSVTTLLVLFAIFLFGGAGLKYFSLVLIVGIALGTYSSLFLATPLLVTYYWLKERR